MTAPQAGTVVGVEELRRAWRAVQDGDFRSSLTRRTSSAGHARDSGHTRSTGGGPAPGVGWVPVGPVVVVVGCAGSVGATTTALAVATAAGAARVVECCTLTASGLVAASTGELGRHRSGWNQGHRDQVLLERTDRLLVGVEEVPVPAGVDGRFDLTVVDVGWDPATALGTRSWIADLLRDGAPVVAVAAPTIPGLRRLEGTLALLPACRVVAAVRGPCPGLGLSPGRGLRVGRGLRRGRWLKGVEHTAGPLTRDLIRRGGLVEVPHDAGLAVRGLTSAPLPAAVLAAGAHLYRLTQPANLKGNPS